MAAFNQEKAIVGAFSVILRTFGWTFWSTTLHTVHHYRLQCVKCGIWTLWCWSWGLPDGDLIICPPPSSQSPLLQFHSTLEYKAASGLKSDRNLSNNTSSTFNFFLAISLKVNDCKQSSFKIHWNCHWWQKSFVLIPIENCPAKGLSGWMPAVTGY